MKIFIEKNKKILLTILIILITITVGIIIFFSVKKILNKSKIRDVTKNNYFVQYDNSWKVVKEDEKEFELHHKKSNSIFNIKINDLNEEDQYKTMDEILDNLLYNIQEQNKDYKLIYKENAKLTKNNMEGYTILFENETKQAEISFYKQGDKIVVLTFEASFEYFDILIDSVNNIIYSFSANGQKYDVVSNINLNTTEITYTEQPDVEELLSKTNEYQIANANYLVQYSIPDYFETQDYDSQYGNYRFKDKNIQLRTSILKCNLYEYLDEENSLNIYDSYNLNNYNKEKAELNKFSNEPLGYIYKNSYLTNNQITENIAIIYELNNNHIFIAEISSEGVGIPEKLVNMIKITKSENIASNITVEKKEEKLIGKLKRFTDYTREKTEEITLKLPENYQEVDKEINLFKERNYAVNYDEEKEIYEFEVQYQTISFGIESELEILDKAIYKDYGKYKEFEQINDITVNNKVFKAYKRGYTERSYATDKNGNRYQYYANEIVLFYKLQEDSYLVIVLKANEDEISNEQIEQLTNFDINII